MEMAVSDLPRTTHHAQAAWKRHRMHVRSDVRPVHDALVCVVRSLVIWNGPQDAPKKRVVITGMGVVSCLGHEHDEFYNALLAGKSGISMIEVRPRPRTHACMHHAHAPAAGCGAGCLIMHAAMDWCCAVGLSGAQAAGKDLAAAARAARCMHGRMGPSTHARRGWAHQPRAYFYGMRLHACMPACLCACGPTLRHACRHAWPGHAILHRTVPHASMHACISISSRYDDVPPLPQNFDTKDFTTRFAGEIKVRRPAARCPLGHAIADSKRMPVGCDACMHGWVTKLLSLCGLLACIHG